MLVGAQRRAVMGIAGVVGDITVLREVHGELDHLAGGRHDGQHEQQGEEPRPHEQPPS